MAKRKEEERLVIGLFKGPEGFRVAGDPSILVDFAKESFQSAMITILGKLLQARETVLDYLPTSEPPVKKKRVYRRKVTPVMAEL